MLTDYLPTTKKELDLRGWDSVDVVLFSGDAYVDHPSFSSAVIGRVLEAEGFRVALVPQPDWHGDWRDFKKLGAPRLFFAVCAGNMDSMVNHYTANRRLRSNDAYSPDGRAGLRPDNCTITYCRIIRQLFPNTPLVIGGIEASMRRLTHYDYWTDTVRPSVLAESGADLLVYGMGELPVCQIAHRLAQGDSIAQLTDIPQTAYLANRAPEGIMLASYEQCLKDKTAYADNFRLIEEQSNRYSAQTIVEPYKNRYVVVNPPFPPMTTEQLDHTYSLPYQRQPHPKYKGKTIPAFEMIRFSVNTHRGCFGGCAFCTISAHQGKFVSSRSKQSIMQEIEIISRQDDFKGYLSDLGGPSANMYMMHGKNIDLCRRCKRPTCLQPTICPNLNQDFRPLIDLYQTVDRLPYIKKAFVSSGIRYDLMSEEYALQLITRHVSGRLKVAPEHTATHVLQLMRKPKFEEFVNFNRLFNKINREYRLNQQLIPYFISSHPGCTLEDMAELAAETKRLNFELEQVQDFTPTPMSLATTMYYTGINPYTHERVFVARDKNAKLAQRQFFFWYKKEYRQTILQELHKLHRPDLARILLEK